MARLSALGIPPEPRMDAYSRDLAGNFQFTRDALDWIIRLVDATDDHRKGSIETWTKEFGRLVAQHEEDLRPADSRNPGWIAIKMLEIQAAQGRFALQVDEDNKALVKDNARIRKQLKWQNGLAISALVAMLVFFAQQLIVKGSIT
jgi:hypothetical protein